MKTKDELELIKLIDSFDHLFSKSMLKYEEFSFTYDEAKTILEKGKLLAREEELEFLCDNRDIIDGVDVIVVDKRIKQLKKDLK